MIGILSHFPAQALSLPKRVDGGDVEPVVTDPFTVPQAQQNARRSETYGFRAVPHRFEVDHTIHAAGGSDAVA